MTVVADALDAPLRDDFRIACLHLIGARDEQRYKDTPWARAHVLRCRAEIDRVLDLHNAVHVDLPTG